MEALTYTAREYSPLAETLELIGAEFTLEGGTQVGLGSGAYRRRFLTS